MPPLLPGALLRGADTPNALNPGLITAALSRRWRRETGESERKAEQRWARRKWGRREAGGVRCRRKGKSLGESRKREAGTGDVEVEEEKMGGRYGRRRRRKDSGFLCKEDSELRLLCEAYSS